MNEGSTGRFIPMDDAQAAVLYDALRALDTNAAFQLVLKRIADRLREIDEKNRQRGSENQYTEAQAWAWLLSATAKARCVGEQKIIELQV